jgi:hypothetical protein
MTQRQSGKHNAMDGATVIEKESEHYWVKSDKRIYCKNCSKNYSASATTAILRHIKQEHATKLPKSQPKPTTSLQKMLQPKYTQESYENAVVELIVSADIPFSIVENPLFRKLQTVLKPDVNMFSS